MTCGNKNDVKVSVYQRFYWNIIDLTVESLFLVSSFRVLPIF